MDSFTLKVKGIIERHTKANPIFSAEIERYLSCKGEKVREAVRDLRRHGNLISGKNGYYVARTPEEYLELRNEFTSRINSLDETLKYMDKAAEELFRPKPQSGQLSFV